ncbi:MAG: double zinc ribbon domain-containing protein [Candidatus Bathyarchaeia archaeon]
MYCPRCGEEIPADALYCPKCGKRLKYRGDEGEAWREDLDEVAEEISRAFQAAAEEVRKAFRRFRDSHQQDIGTTVCPQCGDVNPVSANFCYNCGRRLSEKSVEES